MSRIMLTCALLCLTGTLYAQVDSRSSASTPNSEDLYHLRPGDSLQLEYRLTPEFNQTVPVQPDGSVFLGELGSVPVGGLSVQQAHTSIVAAASKRLNHPELIISLKEIENPYVTVAGEVVRPGRVDLRQRTTVLQAILASGGFRDSGYDTHVYLYRRINSEDSEVRQLNLHDIRRTADLDRDVMLRPGDMILVPRNKLEKFSRIIHSTNTGLFVDPTNIH